MANSSIKLTDIPLASNISINSKLLAVDFETEKTELITTKDLIVYLSNTVTYRDQVNTAYELANSAFVTANAAYEQSLEVFDLSNTAYLLANASFDTANTVYELGNSVFIQANNAYSMSNQAFDLANTSEIIVFANYNSVNNMYEMTNSIALQVNSHYELSNTIVIQSELSVNTANYALTVANITFDLVNSISFIANTSYEISNAAIINSNNTLLYSYYAFDVANGAYDQANIAFNLANSVSDQIETVLDSANNAYIHANDAYNTANTKLSLSGGTISGNLSILGPVVIENNLTVAGNVTSISANNLILQDNMIYLNDGAANNANPDLGIVGAYNDGVYRHTGIFRDATDGIWKIFDQYEPEPDESVYIDTSNSTFRIANFQANNITANVFISTANIPIIISSTNLIENLNSDLLDGLDSTYFISYIETSFNQANTGVIQAQAAFAAANNVAPQIEPAFNQANTGVIQAQAAFVQANTANINAANASFLSTGIIDTALLGSGTANSITYLAGDNTWKMIAGFSSTDDTSTDETYYPVIATTAGGSTAKTSSTKLYYNPSTGTLSATIFNSLSDENLKKNIINISNGLEIIEKIDAVEFEWVDSDQKSFGVIAQQLEMIVPDLVTTDKNKTVNYNGLIAFLIKSVQELSLKVKELENQIKYQ